MQINLCNVKKDNVTLHTDNKVWKKIIGEKLKLSSTGCLELTQIYSNTIYQL